MTQRTPRNPAPAAQARRILTTPRPGEALAPAPGPLVEPLAPTPACAGGLVVTEQPAPPPFDPATFDPATFDPNEFEWRPVPRRPRADGWTPDVQRAFIQALANTGLVEQAAREVDMSVQSAYNLRRSPGGESFAQAWRAALAAAAERVLDLAFSRAIEGDETPVFDRDGCRIGARRKVSDRMALSILRAYMPERFRHAHQDTIQPGERLASPAQPVAEALAALGPAVPAEPHRLMPPERLAEEVQVARAVAEVYARYPADERERYVHPRVEEDHAAATERAVERRLRRYAQHCDEALRDDDASKAFLP